MGIEVLGGKAAGNHNETSKEERERYFESAWRSVITHVPEINHAIEYGEFYPQNLLWRIEDMIMHLNQMGGYLLDVKTRK